MKRTPLNRKTQLKAKKRINPTSDKTKARNLNWRQIVMDKAHQMFIKDGVIRCEFSGEPIYIMSPLNEDMNAGWGHHIDKNRRNCQPQNCFIVKYKWHSFIHDNNIDVRITPTYKDWLNINK